MIKVFILAFALGFLLSACSFQSQLKCLNCEELELNTSGDAEPLS